MLDGMDTTMFYRLAWRAGALTCTGKQNVALESGHFIMNFIFTV